MGISGATKRRCACSPVGCGVCGAVSFALGVLLLLVGIWATHLFARFTPVYREIVCELEPPRVERIWSENPDWHIKMTSRSTCRNPNPYTVTLGSTRPGQVYMGHDRTPVGNVTGLPAATLPAGGQGVIQADLDLVPTGDLLPSALSLLLGPIPIYMENNLDVTVDIELLVGKVSVAKSFSKDCGMNLRMDHPLQAVVGPMACAEDWASLEVPPVAGGAPRNTLSFSAASMGDGELARAAHLKNTSLGAMMAVGYAAGLLLLISGAFELLCCVRGRRAAAAAAAEAGTTNSTKDLAPEQVGQARVMQAGCDEV